MTGSAEGIAWERLRADEHGPCMAAGCNDPLVAATVIIDGHRYHLCHEDAEQIPGYAPNLLERSIP